MSKQEEQLNALNDIKKLMDRSSRFISLSGLSGVFAGVTALLGAYLAHVEINNYLSASGQYSAYPVDSSLLDLEFNLLKIGFGVLGVALAGGLLFTLRQSRKRNLPFWDRTTKNLLINLAIPLVSGGLFIIALLLVHPNTYGLIAPACLVFYGLALINASKYTYSDIRFLGLCEIVLGLIAMFYIGYGLYFWAIGFGILHIFYGMLMYFKYERAR
jgi:predicted lysophospholipase L1 biosynthesis ABC-type transport system permease subunit